MSTPPPTVYQPSDLSEEVINGKNTKNALVTNPQTGGLSFGKIPPNNNGVSEGEIYLKLGLAGHGRLRKGAFGARHVWEKHKSDLGITTPDQTPMIIAEILSEGVDILLSTTDARPIALNTKYGVVILEEKVIDQVTSYSIVSAYGKKNIAGIVIGQLIKPS